MCLTGLENERVAGFDRSRSALMTNDSLTRDHVVELPLRAVRVIRVRRRPRRDAADLHVKRMPLVELGCARLASEGLGNLFAGTDEFSARRPPSHLIDFVRADFLHS